MDLGRSLHGSFKKRLEIIQSLYPGVILELSKGKMIFDIVALINSGVITTADLVDFSDELKESVDFILHR